MTKYISAAFAFGAALVGIIGDVREPTRPGIAGITALGWVAILVALLSFIVILVETRRDRAKINWQEKQKTMVQLIANRQVVDAVLYLLRPFQVLLKEIRTKRNDLDFDLEQIDKSPSYVVSLLSNPTVRAEFSSVNLRAKPNVAPPILWWEYFANHASEARELLNQAAAKYSGYLDADTLVAIEEIRADELVYFRLPRLGELESENRQIDPFPLSYAFGPRDGYGALDVMLEKLRKVLEHIDIGERAA